MSDFPDTIQGRLATPEDEHLLTVREESDRKLLEKDQATSFHNSVAGLLFATTRISKGIHRDVTFLTTRLWSPDEDDWQKLRE